MNYIDSGNHSWQWFFFFFFTYLSRCTFTSKCSYAFSSKGINPLTYGLQGIGIRWNRTMNVASPCSFAFIFELSTLLPFSLITLYSYDTTKTWNQYDFHRLKHQYTFFPCSLWKQKNFSLQCNPTSKLQTITNECLCIYPSSLHCACMILHSAKYSLVF